VLVARVILGESILEVKDLVVSCRVAEMAVENSFFEWLRTEGAKIKAQGVAAAFVPSSKNEILERSLRRCGFKPATDGSTLWIDGSVPVPDSNIVRPMGQFPIPDSRLGEAEV